MDTLNNDNKKGTIPEALQGAFILVFGYHAAILNQPISALSKGNFQWSYILLIFMVLINLFNVIANWISAQYIGKKEINYKFNHLFWDLVTLAIFFIFSDVIKEKMLDIKYCAIVIGEQYILLHIVYIGWNYIEISNQRKLQQPDYIIISILKKANIGNIIALPFAIFLLISSIINCCDFVVWIAFVLWIVAWVWIIILYIKENSLI
jgi:hypothetical protein